ncbi:cyclodeaminase/cyclohydrolase family protein [Candidatus Aerophobetes bacterium]|nr:cyclodeaminase/cyclohydrolase family protein [Candidatus Aerophobetes bacterium]
MYLDQPLRSFLEDTASKTPTPGGGSVAALVGSLGAALLCMVGNFTLGKPKFEKVERDVREILKEADKLKEELSGLIQKDIEVYARFSQTSRMPRDTSELKEKRRQALQIALKNATQVPMTTAKLALRLLELAQLLLSKGNPNLITDVGVGALLADAALQSAALNVQINLGYIKDEEFRKRTSSVLSSMLSQGQEIKDKVVKGVRDALEG